jgi:flagella basal body P-ring formation protein FlgA
MVYKNGLFEVSATGVALEAGGRGHEIRVRNEASKKIIAATVLEPGLVGVKP